MDKEISQIKSFSSLQEFRSLEELPNTKPLVLMNNKGDIEYSNSAFNKYLKGEDTTESFKFESDPSLYLLIEGLAKSNYSSFHTEMIIYDSKKGKYESTYIDVERILIELKEFFIVIFTPYKIFDKIEKKLNNLHNALEYGDVPVIITDAKGMINYVSKSFETIIQKSIDDLYKNSLLKALDSFFSEKDFIELEKAIVNKESYLKLISDLSEDGELWFKEIKLNPVRTQEAEEINFILTAHDITGHILKNRILRRAKQRQNSIFDNISDILLIIREEKDKLILETANDNFFNEFHVEKEFIIEKDINDFFPKQLGTFLISIINEIGNEKLKVFRFTDNVFKREYLCKLTYIIDLYENDKLFIINLEDITEQLRSHEKLKRAYEKENKLNKLKTAFLANMSHEVRTPLNAIVGYSDLLEDEIEDGDKETMLELTGYLKDGVKRLLKLVDNIVEVSILESGEEKFDMEKFNVNYLLHNFYDTTFKFVTKQNIKYNTDFSSTDLYIEIDELKLKKILDVLIENAVKYNKSEGAVILRSQRAGDFVQIEIEDTGKGISDKKIKDILEPFSQEEEESYTRNYEGAGLGLTIAFRLTQQLNGQFDIKSKVEEGTTVTLTFPIIKK